MKAKYRIRYIIKKTTDSSSVGSRIPFVYLTHAFNQIITYKSQKQTSLAMINQS